MISVRGLSKSYRGVKAVDDLTFDVRTSAPDLVMQVLEERGVTATRSGLGDVLIEDLTVEEVGEIAHAAGAPIMRLVEHDDTLEQAYLRLTEDTVQYRGTDAGEG